MHINIIKDVSEIELQSRVNKIIRDLENTPAIERNFTRVIDVKISAGYQEYIATIIFDN
jgi:hypothetical protein